MTNKNNRFSKWARRTKRKLKKFKRAFKNKDTFRWYFKYSFYGGTFYDFFGKTRCLRLRHKDGRTLGYNTDSFGTLSDDKLKAKRYSLSKKYGKDHWLDSGKTKLDNLFKRHGDNLGGILTKSTFDRGGYGNFDKGDLYFDLYRYTLKDRLSFFRRYYKIRKSWTDHYKKTGQFDY